jgi:hypothetical protein
MGNLPEGVLQATQIIYQIALAEVKIHKLPDTHFEWETEELSTELRNFQSQLASALVKLSNPFSKECEKMFANNFKKFKDNGCKFDTVELQPLFK